MTTECVIDAMNVVARGIRADFPRWPSGACVESTMALVAVLSETGIVPVWGRVAFLGDWEPHAWAELPDGTILDMTAGQFLGGAPWRIFPPGHPDHDCYEDELRGEDVIRAALFRMIDFAAQLSPALPRSGR